MKNFVITLILILISNAAFAQLKYKLPDVTLTANQICGTKICTPGNVGFLLHLTQTPYSPSLEKGANDPKEIALQVLGQTLPAGVVRVSKDFSTCSGLSDNPFTLKDVENVKFPDGRTIEYSRKEKLEINIKAAADANIKDLMKLTADAAKIERLRAKIEASYGKIKGKELIVTGKYSEWELSKNAREQIKKGTGFQSCREWVVSNNQRIILAVGLVYFDIKSEQNSLDELASAIDAELAKEGISGSLSFRFKKEVTQRFKSACEVYQIVIIRHAGIDNTKKEFIQTAAKSTVATN